ncbi:hypothetical protein ACW0UW_08165 [[Haemophilus] ducreyi]
MSIHEAYCVQLERVVSITEARTEFLSRSPCKRFDFLCSTESCRQRGVKIIGINYDHFPDEIRQSPHFKYRTTNNRLHSPECQWRQTITERLVGESEEEYKIRKMRSRLHDFIDEFQLPEDEFELSERTKKTATKTASKREQRDASSTIKTTQQQKRYIITNQLMRLVEVYLDARRNLPEKDFLALPLKVTNSSVKFLYQYFRRAENAIKDKHKCVCIGEVEFFDRAELLYFKLRKPYQEDKSAPPIPICLGIRKSILETYRYRRMLRSHIDSNPYEHKYFKVYFIPNENDFNLKTVKNKEGKETDIYFFEIDDLNLFCLFNYSYLKKKK